MGQDIIIMRIITHFRNLKSWGTVLIMLAHDLMHPAQAVLLKLALLFQLVAGQMSSINLLALQHTTMNFALSVTQYHIRILHNNNSS